MGTYATRPLTAEALQWDGTSAPGIMQLTDGLAIITEEPDGTLTITAEGQQDRTVHPGWWVSRTGDDVIVHSGHAFGILFGDAG